MGKRAKRLLLNHRMRVLPDELTEELQRIGALSSLVGGYAFPVDGVAAQQRIEASVMKPNSCVDEASAREFVIANRQRGASMLDAGPAVFERH